MREYFKAHYKRKIAVCLLFALIIGLLEGSGLVFYADEPKTGMIYSSTKENVLTREEPSDSAERKRTFVYGKPVTVVEETTDAKGDPWYKISYIVKSTQATETSYVRAENVKLDKDMKAFAFGQVNSTNINLRDDAGTSGTKILTVLTKGNEVELLDEHTILNGETWYRVRYKNGSTTYVGWMYKNYIDLVRYNVEIDPAYVEELKTKGFPESYTYNLAVLHALYPEWIFEPVMTGLDWNTVIAEETKNPINMVPISADDAKKSVKPTDYIWETNKWVITDGDSWVAVHPDYLAYVMDPRNFLTEEYIFQFESLSYKEQHTIEGVQSIIGTSFMSKDVTDADGKVLNYANAFVTIGKEVGVSPYHLVSRVLQEQGRNGTSSLISGKYSGYEGYYNYFNFGAHGITDAAVITAGLKYAQKQGWNTRYKSLYGGAANIAKNYISRGQDTLYFQKFNVVWKDMLYGHQYMGNVNAAMSEGKKMATAYDNKHQSFVFRIPVYNNMPAKAVEFKVSGNRNNYLKELSVSGLSLTPTFTGATTEYNLIVDNAISSVNITASPVVAEAKVTGTGTHNLQVGTNTIKILCQSESGDIRTYTLTIVREAPEEPVDPPVEPPTTKPTEPDEPGSSEPGTGEPTEPGDSGSTEPGSSEPGTGEPTEPSEPEVPVIPAGISSSKYQIGKYITGVATDTKADVFLSAITMQGNATVKLLTAKGEVQTGTVGTGNILQVYDGETLIATHEVLIYGDVNGDGQIKMSDLLSINRHVIGTIPLKNVYLQAGDVNRKGDGATMSDLLAINRHVLGTILIEQ